MPCKEDVRCVRVVVAGNIGAGKSTLIERLARRGLTVVPEPFDEWNDALERFRLDPGAYALALQLQVLRSFDQHRRKVESSGTGLVVYERSPSDARDVFVKRAIAAGYIDRNEQRAYAEASERIGWEPHAVVYLRSDPFRCAERTARRGRACEVGMTDEDFCELHDLYEEWYLSLRCPKIALSAEAPPEEVARAGFDAVCAVSEAVVGRP